MPYSVRKSGKRFALVKKSSGKVVGRHRSRAAANRQRRAIYANKRS